MQFRKIYIYFKNISVLIRWATAPPWIFPCCLYIALFLVCVLFSFSQQCVGRRGRPDRGRGPPAAAVRASDEEAGRPEADPGPSSDHRHAAPAGGGGGHRAARRRLPGGVPQHCAGPERPGGEGGAALRQEEEEERGVGGGRQQGERSVPETASRALAH